MRVLEVLSGRTWRRAGYVAALSAGLVGLAAVGGGSVLGQMASAPAAAPMQGTGVLPPAQVEKLLPASAYFKGQTAPLQLRNAAAIRDASGAVAWVSLVDTSGYSTGVRERYQFYVVSELPLQFGNAVLPAGAYGAGFLASGTATVMDLGAHDVAKTPVVTDDALHRPRPLQIVADGAGYRLYLGRQYVAFGFKR